MKDSLIQENLLIDDHERLVGPIAEFLLERNDLLDPLVGERPLGFDQLVTLTSGLVEETRVYLTEKQEKNSVPCSRLI